MNHRTDDPRSGFTSTYLVYAVGLLFAVNLLNVIDRMILGILVNSIKKELLLTDTQLSLVSGFSFVLFYMIAGFAVSRMIDTGNRRRILSVGILVWSLATALTGLAQDYVTLLVSRVLVGAGEATAFPVAMSLIGDMFSKERRPRVVSIFQASNVAGVVSGSVLAGILGQQYGWRAVFILMGVIGVGVALLNFLSLREPVREAVQPRAEGEAPSSLLTALREVLRIPGFVSLSLGYGLAYTSLGMMVSWAPTFLQRSHGLDVAQVGKVIGPVVGIGGLVGTIVAGVVASRLVARSADQRTGLKVTISLLPFATPFFAIFLFAPTLPLALLGSGLANFCIASVLGPPMALVLGLANSGTRAVSSTVMLTVQGLLAGGLAPLLVGLGSDLLQPRFGDESLRYAMTATLLPPLLAALLFLHAYRKLAPTARGAAAAGAPAPSSGPPERLDRVPSTARP